jgi:hypothetical protein
MKKILLFGLAAFVQFAHAQTNETFHDFNAVTIRGDSISLSDFAGKKIIGGEYRFLLRLYSSVCRPRSFISAIRWDYI